DSTVCAGGMNADVGRFIELPPSLVERVLPVLRLTADGRTTQWRFPTAPFLTVERRSLDALLAERATGAGVRLFTEARVTAVSPGESALHSESGARRVPRRARAAAFVFADGPSSLAHQVLTAPRGRRDAPRYVAVEYDLDGPEAGLEALEIVTDA